MAESEKLPPNLRALKQHILRACVQDTVLGQAAVPQQELLDSGEWIPQGQRCLFRGCLRLCELLCHIRH